MNDALAYFLGFLFLFTVIGLLSASQRKTTAHDYLVASGGVKPWMAGLSACASLISGGSLIGMTGFVYSAGISATWLYTGYLVYPFLLYFMVPRIQKKSGELKLHTYSALLARWQGVAMPWVRRLSAVLIIALLAVYAAAQLKGGGKL